MAVLRQHLPSAPRYCPCAASHALAASCTLARVCTRRSRRLSACPRAFKIGPSDVCIRLGRACPQQRHAAAVRRPSRWRWRTWGWYRVGNRAGARSRWKRPFDFPILMRSAGCMWPTVGHIVSSSIRKTPVLSNHIKLCYRYRLPRCQLRRGRPSSVAYRGGRLGCPALFPLLVAYNESVLNCGSAYPVSMYP